MNYIDYPVFQQFLDEYERFEEFLFKKFKEIVEKEQKCYSLNVTEFEFDYENNTVNVINGLMGLKKHDPKSCCELPIDDFFDILIQRKIAEKNPKQRKK